ncbi:MAG: tetraacyldisaccharide 4'-kinase [Gammaproteobacteria bacterium]|nr:tetraacyldisaccharide 4'-kinase [Gammaproteobacteria bacterium]
MIAARDVLENAWYRGAAWLWLLRPLEAVFRTFAAARRGLYHSRLLPVFRPPVPVVVVGNITVGGTGKTPVVIALVESLQQRGIKVGVVSRGYGARAPGSPLWVHAHSDAGRCGDEPLLIQRRTGCPCVVASRRAQAVHTLLARCAVDIIISDDGLQHYALARDLEIAVFDAQRGTGNGFCLPAGPLREPVKRLREVGHVLYRGSADPRNGVRYAIDSLVNLETGEARPAAPAALGREVVAVAGIGQPLQFMETLVALGFEPEQHCFADHHRYTAADFAGLGDRPIIMTEKDAVKCAGLAGDNAWYLKINAVLPDAVTSAVVALARS